jgi:hypothetical protein
MARRDANDEIPGQARLLDAWLAPDEAGEPIGILATTFTFSAAFFEEECLARFLGIESDPLEDGPFYLIEREEKLSAITCAAVIVDAHQARGARSLRWDLLPLSVERGGVLHAKVSLLCWSRLVRVIVASANLTEDGYRRNREIFGVLDFSELETLPPSILGSVIVFLRSLVDAVDPQSPVRGRIGSLLDWAAEFGRRVAENTEARVRENPRIFPIFAGVGGEGIPQQIEQHWPGGSPPTAAYVTSPFFDPPDAPNRPAESLWQLLRQRGEAELTINVEADPIEKDKTIFLHAPQSLLHAQPKSRQGVRTAVRILTMHDKDAHGQFAYRPLHLKSIWLENDRWAAYLVGSSNFTSAGLGLGRRSNIEANLLYAVSHYREPDLYRELEQAYPETEDLPAGWECLWQPLEDAEFENALQLAVLPPGFGPAIFAIDPKDGEQLILHFRDGLPNDWEICVPESTTTFLSNDQWRQQNRPEQVRFTWHSPAPPSGLEVRWSGAATAAWWPVNVQDQRSLPPPTELRMLPLELLIQILTSTRPLHEVMRRWLRRNRRHDPDVETPVDIDPHARVDASTFLLQRTRRMSWALEALKQRLARPVSTHEALTWRLRGPVGVRTLAEAVAREARSDAERAFLTTELMLELSRVEPQEVPGSLSASEVKKAIRELMQELNAQLELAPDEELTNLARYVDETRAMALK